MKIYFTQLPSFDRIMKLQGNIFREYSKIFHSSVGFFLFYSLNFASNLIENLFFVEIYLFVYVSVFFFSKENRTKVLLTKLSLSKDFKVKLQ